MALQFASPHKTPSERARPDLEGLRPILKRLLDELDSRAFLDVCFDAYTEVDELAAAARIKKNRRDLREELHPMRIQLGLLEMGEDEGCRGYVGISGRWMPCTVDD